jgi:phosphoribosylaminoimidazole-succinocarboxamide synthase
MKEIYRGKAKTVYDDGDEVVIKFRDDITAFDAVKHDQIKGKGFYNAQTSSKLFMILESKGIRTHYIGMDGDTEMRAKKVRIVPLEVIVRNIAAGSITKNYPIEEGTEFSRPIVLFDLKNDRYHDPLLNEDIAEAIDASDREEMAEMRKLALGANDVLKEFFAKNGIKLVDFKLEFGRYGKELLVADEISCDTCRFWNEKNESLDKDLYRFDKGDVLTGYKRIYELVKDVQG